MDPEEDDGSWDCILDNNSGGILIGPEGFEGNLEDC